MIPTNPTTLTFSPNKNTPVRVATTTSTEAMIVAFEASTFNDNPLRYRIFANKPVDTELRIAHNKNVYFYNFLIGNLLQNGLHKNPHLLFIITISRIILQNINCFLSENKI